MKKFKIGDPVYVLSDVERKLANDKVGNGDPGYSAKMFQIGGMLCTIKCYDKFFNRLPSYELVECPSYVWREDWLTSAYEFEIGDPVTVNSDEIDFKKSLERHIGEILTITHRKLWEGELFYKVNVLKDWYFEKRFKYVGEYDLPLELFLV